MNRRLVLVICVYLALVFGGIALSRVVPDIPADDPGMPLAIASAALIYVLASAIPFVPGAEIGFAMMIMMGSAVVPLVYACMLLALSLAYLAGRFVAPHRVAAVFQSLGWQRAADLVMECADTSPAERGDVLLQGLPNGVARFVAKRRYVALAVILNLPGNSFLGGGGGLAFAAGASKVFLPVPFFITIAIAVAPVPILFTVFGTGG